MVSIAGDIRCISVEGIPGNQAKIQPGGGIRIIDPGTRLIFLPVKKAVKICILITQVKIDPSKVSIYLSKIESAQSIIPIFIMFPDLPVIGMSIAGAVNKGLKVIGSALGNAEGEIPLPCRQNMLCCIASVGFQGPDISSTGHDPVIIDGTRYRNHCLPTGIGIGSVSIRGIKGEFIGVSRSHMSPRSSIRGVEYKIIWIPKSHVSTRSGIGGV